MGILISVAVASDATELEIRPPDVFGEFDRVARSEEF